MPTKYLPRREGPLLLWAERYAATLSAAPENYGASAAQAAAVAEAVAAFRRAYGLAQDRTTRSPANIQIKNETRDAMVSRVRAVVAQGQAWPGMTDDKRVALGVTVAKEPVRHVLPPGEPPRVDVVGVAGRTLRVRLRDGATGARRKPAGAMGAELFSYVGPTIPTRWRQWAYEGFRLERERAVTLPDSVEPGAKVWLAARWGNRRHEVGPLSPPVATHVGFGVVCRKAA